MAQYKIKVYTQDIPNTGGEGTDSDIWINLFGEKENKSSGDIRLNGLKGGNIFEAGDIDEFTIEREDFGRVWQIKLRSDGNHSGSDWDLDKIEVTSPSGYQSVFRYSTTITGDETGDTLTRQDEKFPWQVGFRETAKTTDFIKKLDVALNDSPNTSTYTVKRSISEVKVAEVSAEQQTGNSISTDLKYESPETKFGKLSASVGAEWTKTVRNATVDQNSDSFILEKEQVIELPPNSVVGIEDIWAVPKFSGFLTEGNQRYAVKGIADFPDPKALNTIVIPLEGEKKLPHRFKNYLIASGRTDLLQKLVNKDRFENSPAIRFDGIQQWARADSVCQLFTGHVPKFSFSCWAKPTTSDNDDQTLVAFNTSVGGNLNMIGFNAKLRQFFYFDPTTGYMLTSGNYKFDNWYHIHVNLEWGVDGQGLWSMNLYVDGEHTTGRFTGNRPQPSGRFSIGQEWDGETKSDFFHGSIADIRVWQRTFTGEEIRQLNKKRLLGNEEHLVAYYPCDEEEGEVLNDLTGFGNHATVHNGADWVTNAGLPVA